MLGHTQGGSNADVILADAYLKGITEDIDWKAGYAAVKKDAEEEPYDWSSEGRGGLMSWKSLNYIPVEDFDYLGFGTMTRSISRTLEYCYNDFTIAQMARSLEKTGDVERYETSSRNWENLFRDDQVSFVNGTDTGFTGFFQPKYLNGTWGHQVNSLDVYRMIALTTPRIPSLALTLTRAEQYALCRTTPPRHSNQASGNTNCTFFPCNHSSPLPTNLHIQLRPP